jgi:hypothetical protein
MKRLPLILSSVALLLSFFAVHVAWRTKQDVQAYFHGLPAGAGRR